jgi:hypothetical protein
VLGRERRAPLVDGLGDRDDAEPLGAPQGVAPEDVAAAVSRTDEHRFDRRHPRPPAGAAVVPVRAGAAAVHRAGAAARPEYSGSLY